MDNKKKQYTENGSTHRQNTNEKLQFAHFFILFSPKTVEVILAHDTVNEVKMQSVHTAHVSQITKGTGHLSGAFHWIALVLYWQ